MTPEQQVAKLVARTTTASKILGAETAGVEAVAALAGHDAEQAKRIAVEAIALSAGEHPWPPSSWWLTPLGALCAQWADPDPSIIVSPTVAAEILGRSVQRIYQLRSRGVLDGAPGGVTMLSVLQHRAQHDRPTTITIDRLLDGLDVDTLLAVREEFALLEPDEPATCQDSADRELAVTTLAGVAIDARTAIAHVDTQIESAEACPS